MNAEREMNDGADWIQQAQCLEQPWPEEQEKTEQLKREANR